MSQTVAVTSVKGSTTGTIRECAEWLAQMQPSFSAVVTTDGEDTIECDGLWTVAKADRAIRLALCTDSFIESMRDGAGQAGDFAMVETCRRALDGDADARRTCADLIYSE